MHKIVTSVTIFLNETKSEKLSSHLKWKSDNVITTLKVESATMKGGYDNVIKSLKVETSHKVEMRTR